MRTPQFKLSQDDEYLYTHMFIPNAQLNKFQVFYIDELFMCFCPPYYLRLLLPGKVKCWEEVLYGPPKDSYKALEFDPNNFEMTIPMPKEVKGEDFGDLSDLNQFLFTPKDDEDMAEQINCYFRQQLHKEDEEDDDDENDDDEDDRTKLTDKYPYGFND